MVSSQGGVIGYLNTIFFLSFFLLHLNKLWIHLKKCMIMILTFIIAFTETFDVPNIAITPGVNIAKYPELKRPHSPFYRTISVRVRKKNDPLSAQPTSKPSRIPHPKSRKNTTNYYLQLSAPCHTCVTRFGPKN